MFCTKCGNRLPDGIKFCPRCGAAVTPEKQPEKAVEKTKSPETVQMEGVSPREEKPSEGMGSSRSQEPPAPPQRKEFHPNIPGPMIPPAPAKAKKKGRTAAIILAICIPLTALLTAGGLVGYHYYQEMQTDRQCEQLVADGNEAVQDQDLDKALRCYRNALKLRPEWREASLGMADVYLRQKEYQRAEKALDGLELAEDDPLYAQWEELMGISQLDPQLESVNADEFPKVTLTLSYHGDKAPQKDEVTVREGGKNKTLDDFQADGGKITLTYKAEDTGVSEEHRDLAVEWKAGDYSFDWVDEYTTPKILPAQVTLVSTDVSEYPKVKVYLRVEDQDTGENVEGLDLKSITIREQVEGGKYLSREVHQVAPLEGNAGLNTSLIADKSDSISNGDMDKIKQVMKEFVGDLHYETGDKAEVLAFDSIVQQMCTFTSDSALLVNGISNMSTDGTTALYDAVYTGINHAALQGGARCVIAFTDGQDNESYHTPIDLVNYANSCQVPVYIVGVGYGVEESTLRSIAENANGNYWFIDDLYDLQEIFDTVYAEQKELYTVEYTSDKALDQYASRKVEVAVAGSGYQATQEVQFQPVRSIAAETHTSRYELFKEALTWEEATQRCQEKGGHLATITTKEEMDQLVKMSQDAGLTYVWLGGYTSYDNSGKVFGHWVTGEDFSYSAWSKGEPSRVDKDGTEEWYIMLWNMPSLGGWTWNDQRNDPVSEVASMAKSMGYICEYED